mmetsp:Transcript_34112/g.86611  ORF Transcript_34112/g.86611 Transcript_34112/m.86611 type:complete len:302 (-) Transcript_34112:374-1279(-)
MRHDLEGAGALHEEAVGHRVAHGAQPVAHGVLDLLEHVLVRALDEHRAREGVLHALDEGVGLLVEGLLLHVLGVPQDLDVAQHVERVDALAAARQHDALHVALLRAAEREDALTREHVERQRVDALLVDDHKGLARLARLVLEVEDELRAVVDPLALGGDHALALARRVVEEARGHLALLVLEVDVHAEDAALGQLLGHARVAAAVVHHEALDEARLHAGAVLHVHDLDHVQVDGLALAPDAAHRVDGDLGEQVRELRVHLRAQRGGGDLDEQVAVQGVLLLAGRVEHLQRLRLGELDAVA